MEIISLQTRRPINYETEVPLSDAYEFCENCGDFAFEYCSIHGGLLVVPDDEVPEYSETPRAMLSTPRVFLYIDFSSIPGAGAGVFAKRNLPQGVRFGPYRGQQTEKAATDYCWQIHNASGHPSHVIDASDTGCSNWMRYVNCARHSSEQNLVAYQYHGHIYYRTTKIIRRDSELLVFYGCEFAVQLNIHLGRYNKNACQLLHQHDKSTKNSDSETLDSPIDIADALKSSSAELQKVNAYVMGVIKLDKYFNKELKSPKDSEDIQFHSIFESIDIERAGNSQNNNLQWNYESIEEPKKASNGLNDQEQILDITDNDTRDLTDVSNDEFIIDIEDEKNDCENDARESIKSECRDVDQDITKSLWKCSVCNKGYKSKRLLLGHKRIHGGTEIFQCSICSYKTNVKYYFRRHERTLNHNIMTEKFETAEQNAAKQLENKRAWQCQKCKNVFSSRHHLRKHRVTCEVFYKTDIKSNSEKENDIPNTQHKQSVYKCNKCNYSSHTFQVLKNHEDLHANINAFKCEKCDYLCVSRKYLHEHSQRVHVATRLHQCNFCAKAFGCASYLRVHVNRVHLGKKH